MTDHRPLERIERNPEIMLGKPVVRGTRRELVAAVRGLRWAVEGSAAKLEFELSKGCYATSLLREFMKGPSSGT